MSRFLILLSFLAVPMAHAATPQAATPEFDSASPLSGAQEALAPARAFAPTLPATTTAATRTTASNPAASAFHKTRPATLPRTPGATARPRLTPEQQRAQQVRRTPEQLRAAHPRATPDQLRARRATALQRSGGAPVLRTRPAGPLPSTAPSPSAGPEAALNTTE